MSDPDGSDRAGSVELHLLRHAHAGDPNSWEGSDDERPLTGRGRRQAERLSRFLRAIRLEADAVISSPKLRALETARPVARRLHLEVVEDERLGSDVGLARLEELLQETGARRPVLVGHDPDFSALLALLCGASRIPMKKGALARIDTALPLRPGGGSLIWLVPPDLLKRQD